MKNKILLKGPLLTRSGYGEQSRFALRALRSREDLFEVFIQPLEWGRTSWMHENDQERAWIDQTIEKTIAFIQNEGKFDSALQITIPNEWENMAPVNIGFTAGIETTQVAHQWIEKGNNMDHIIVVSNHAKNVYKNTVYTAQEQSTGREFELKLNTPIEVANYPVKSFKDLPELDLELETDFNFLSVAQFGPRKNLPNTVKWFVEEFRNEKVGLVLKTNLAKNCYMDRQKVFHDLKRFLQPYEDRSCKVYLLHGDMDDAEIHSLYKHPKIEALLALTHGEGFGLPLFEAAYSGLPTICPGWSGQLDFLVDKKTGAGNFYNIEYDVKQIPDEVVWDGVLIKESSWAYAREHSAKQQMRRCYSQLTSKESEEILEKFKNHAETLHEEFSPEKRNATFVAAVCAGLKISTEEQENQESELLEFG